MLRYLKNLFILAAFVGPTMLFANTGAGGGVDWLKTVTDQVSDLINQHEDALVAMGTIELSFISLFCLIGIVSRWQLAHMFIGSRHVNFQIGDFFVFLLQLSACLLMLNYYNTPLPGTNIKFHQIFSYTALQIANVFDQTVLNDFLAHVNTAIASTEKPGNPLDVFSIGLYYLVIGDISIARAIMFTVDVAGFIINGIFVLFGPILIPLYMTKQFASKFWGWLDGLLVVSMWRAVAAALSLIWWNVWDGFFDKTLAGDYTLGHWLEVFPILLLITAACIWSTFKIPTISSWIFGGISGQGPTDTALASISTAVRSAVSAL